MAVDEERHSGPNRWLRRDATSEKPRSVPKSIQNNAGGHRKQKADKKRPKTMAEMADKHQLYMQAVQNPRKEVRNLDSIYRTLSARFLTDVDRLDDDGPLHCQRRGAMTLREDFCGTAVLCAEWVRARAVPDRRAYGVDIDSEVVDYAWKHVLCSSDYDNDSRARVICSDVMDVHARDTAPDSSAIMWIPRVDVIAAFNFSVCYFHQRSDLVRYLKHSLANLNDFGLLFCDLFGGSEITQPLVSRIRDLGSFKYLFRQHNYDLCTNTVQISLGFKMKDGSMLKDCFSYRFRLYSLCELKEAMLEAGFDHVSVWTSTKKNPEDESNSDDDDDSDETQDSEVEQEGGDFEAFTEMTSTTEMPYAFNSYIVGIKLPRIKSKCL
ncbi:hypothetical protein COEREDRAFT_97433 [Coemansia reversa NRRL 1564]|uniref:Uncharacterized protein n=1 Tax=Coemansia reversa (strain ATCC 12441 / NRRL 1564) TaxID=763665 RepID=A0A2G5BC36_COERN|nr:hypothetical protein COEREDRAFT_97433 [Coemansia reversa NRRL 1564]|eukprot:PIA16573.1 hypothetical protein COEREDRAFT_97433 [Coemansia reversa NRRL 1564]